MGRKLYFAFSFVSLALVAMIYFVWPPVLWYLAIILPIIILGIFDMHSTHNVLRLYPVVGHLRYMFEFIRPEIQQYFVATNLSGRPYNREQRSLIYQRAKQMEDTLPFGTQHSITEEGYELAFHSLAPKELSDQELRVTVGGPACKQPYSASRLNISAMSFGALSPTAVLAMNKGAKIGGFAHNTGEGGLSAHHLAGGGDIIWQIGTGYFGCRTVDGHFDAKQFTLKATQPIVKMIEIKLSQGAKPSHGGVLPAAKINEEIAAYRGVPMGEDCISPSSHRAFSTPEGLLSFVQELRTLSQGKPIGFKICIGKKNEFMAICKAMLSTGIIPDFITVDGAEGGTGAAPVEYSNRLGLPINEGLSFVHNCLVGINKREEIRLIASGKIATGFDMLTKLALGADMCNAARMMMFAVGCIQALRCNNNTCPTGVTTQDPNRYLAIDTDHKKHHVKNLHQNTLKSLLDLAGAMGLEHLDDLSPEHVSRRTAEQRTQTLAEFYPQLTAGALLQEHVPQAYATDWKLANEKAF